MESGLQLADQMSEPSPDNLHTVHIATLAPPIIGISTNPAGSTPGNLSLFQARATKIVEIGLLAVRKQDYVLGQQKQQIHKPCAFYMRLHGLYSAHETKT
jgi:hypothetical protein